MEHVFLGHTRSRIKVKMIKKIRINRFSVIGFKIQDNIIMTEHWNCGLVVVVVMFS